MSPSSTDPSRIAEVNRPDRVRAQIAELRESRPVVESPAAAPAVERTAPYDLVIRGQRILTTAGITDREVGIRDGKIVAIEPHGHGLEGTEVITLADDETLIPGLVDTHVHINEPGRTRRLGRLRHRDQGRRCRLHHGHRHAAELHPLHRQRTGPGAQATRGRRPGLRVLAQICEVTCAA